MYDEIEAKTWCLLFAPPMAPPLMHVQTQILDRARSSERMSMSWQETLDKVSQFSPGNKHGYERTEKLFCENILLDILNNKRIISLITKWLCEKSKIDQDISQKDLERAEYFRQEGNRYYVKGTNAKALELYNDSIRHYPLTVSSSNNDRQSNYGVSLAYANRSAVFFNWKQYKKCLADIEKAFELNYPDILRHKLFKRRAECFIELGKLGEAKSALVSATQSVIDNQGSIKGKERIMSVIDELQKKVKDLEPYEKEQVDVSESKCVAVANDGNKQLLGTSDGVRLCFNAAIGRHLIAEKKFTSGDVLIVEDPFASVALQKLYKSHCRQCLLRADDMVPCLNCCTQTYCSEKCRADAWQQKHYFECGHLVRLHEIGIASIALHIVLRTDAKLLLNHHMKTLQREDVSGTPFGLNNEKIRSDYNMIYSLTSHTKDMNFCDLIEYAITAVALLFILKQGKFFEKPEIMQLKEVADAEYGKLCQDLCSKKLKDKHNQDSINAIEVLYGSLLFKHIQQLVCNGIAVTGICDVHKPESRISTYTQMRLGTGIYGAASLMNHSCNPNCIQTFVGNTIVIKAAKDIKAGQELTISYGPLFSKVKWEERQFILKHQYFFTCHCEKCRDGPEDDSDIYAFKCQHCEGPISNLDTGVCLSCKEPFDEKWFRQEHLKLAVPVQKFLPPSRWGLRELEKTLKMKEKIFYKYNRILSETHNAIACLYAQFGKYQKAKTHFRKALEIEKFIYGEESIEVGRNLETYSGLLMECLQAKMVECSMTGFLLPDFNEVKECMSVVQKAIQILSTACASVNDSEELSELKQREKYLFEMLRNEKY